MQRETIEEYLLTFIIFGIPFIIVGLELLK